jgi:hypothetical protein
MVVVVDIRDPEIGITQTDHIYTSFDPIVTQVHRRWKSVPCNII